MLLKAYQFLTFTTSVEVWQEFCRLGRRAASLAARAADGGTCQGAGDHARKGQEAGAGAGGTRAPRAWAGSRVLACEPGMPAPPISEVSGAGLPYRRFEAERLKEQQSLRDKSGGLISAIRIWIMGCMRLNHFKSILLFL